MRSLGIILIVLFGVLLYIYFSFKKYKIFIVKKIILTKDGNKIYSVVDKNNNKYILSNYLYKFNFKIDNVWDTISEGNIYSVESIGYRIPFLNLYPKLINIEKN